MFLYILTSLAAHSSRECREVRGSQARTRSPRRRCKSFTNAGRCQGTLMLRSLKAKSERERGCL